jgi:hypothetical protein
MKAQDGLLDDPLGSIESIRQLNQHSTREREKGSCMIWKQNPYAWELTLEMYFAR